MFISPSAWTQRNAEITRLLDGTARGDPEAFADLYQRTSAMLFGIILRVCASRSESEDVLQEVFIKIWRTSGTYDATLSQPVTWLVSIARNQSIDSLRSAARRPVHHCAAIDPDSEELFREGVADPVLAPLAILERRLDARGVARCLGLLGPYQRQSIAMAFYDGMSYSEVSHRLGQPIGTVKSWIRRGLLSLRTCLAEDLPSVGATDVSSPSHPAAS